MAKERLWNRALVLLVLLIGVFAPMLLWPVVCGWLVWVAVLLAGFEWLHSCILSSKASYFKKGLSMVMLVAWFVPAVTFLDELFDEAGCPGHRKSLETIAIVMVVSDSAQLFSGRMAGEMKTLVVPSLSPSKSMEGYLGGMIVALVYGYLIHNWELRQVVLVFCSGVVGDLYFSAAKRLMGLKDFSKLLQSHGGICDRLDSTVFALLILHAIECPSR